MSSFNRIILMGRLTRDPELRYSAKGTAVTKMGLAVNRVYKDEEGTRNEETNFFNLCAFGKRAETLAKFTEKGRPLFVEGRLNNWSYEGEDGQTRRGTDVIVERFEFLSSRRVAAEEEAEPLAA